MRIGVDVGGTFTDVVLFRDEALSDTPVVATKASRPTASADGVMEAIEKVWRWPARSRPTSTPSSGTTIGTSALIERAGAKTALLTTAGFRDVLETPRPAASRLYDFTVDNPSRSRGIRLDIPERVDKAGRVVRPLDEKAMRDAAVFLKQEGGGGGGLTTSSGSCTRRTSSARATSREALPECQYIASGSHRSSASSSDVDRGHQRLSDPTVRSIWSRWTKRVQKFSNGCDLRIVQASGGTMTVKATLDRVVLTVNSGPAGGATAGLLRL